MKSHKGLHLGRLQPCLQILDLGGENTVTYYERYLLRHRKFYSACQGILNEREGSVQFTSSLRKLVL